MFWFPGSVSTPVVGLLNVSPYLPNQVAMALTGLAVFVAIRAWTYRRARSMWDGPYRAAGLTGLWVFLTVSVFVFSGLYDPLKPWQPTLHMLEEIGTMGALTYLAFDVTRSIPVAANNPLLELLLKSSAVVFPACWVSALALGYSHPFPMTGLFHDLPPEAFIYRALLVVSCLLYAGLMTAVVLRSYLLARAEGADPPYKRRLGFFVLGHMGLFSVAADQLAWAYLQSFAANHTLRLLAPWQVVTENALFCAIGVFWTLGIVSPHQHSPTDQGLDDHKRFLRRLRDIRDDLRLQLGKRGGGAYWRGTLDHIRRAAEDPVLRLSPSDEARAEKVFELVVANSEEANEYGPEALLDCDRLYTTLMDELPRSSPERATLASDPLPTALRPAAHALQRSRTGHDAHEAARQPRWAQLGYAAAADLALLDENVLPGLDPSVVTALRRAKAQDDDPVAL